MGRTFPEWNAGPPPHQPQFGSPFPPPPQERGHFAYVRGGSFRSALHLFEIMLQRGRKAHRFRKGSPTRKCARPGPLPAGRGPLDVDAAARAFSER
ncbi:hypothetical protein Taro_015361 [Colocasia esculenta]|uniref:Uncharacterized protein n=1 Tax=Colocasia esculenta TaxID=4460 RepID=A0A843ULY5_COLES|nr:hypothetical protein [Colocasia esculenta]